MGDFFFEEVLSANRERYCWKYEPQESASQIVFEGLEPKELVPKLEEPKTPEVITPPPMLEVKPKDVPEMTGRGGETHVQIQSMIKSIANQYGWKADLEYQVKGGAVDVWIERAGLSIACEISVTTPTDYEIQNVEKCLSAGADEVWVISEDQDKLATLEQAFKDKSNVFFFSPDNIPVEIEARSDMETSDQSQVRGFSVSINRAYTTQTDLDMRRARIDHLVKTHRS